MDLNWLDLLLLAVVLFGVLAGWRRGFVLAALELAVLVASVIVAFLATGWVARVVEFIWISGGVWIAPLSFLIAFALAYLVLGVAAGRVVRAVPRRAHAHALNRVLGMAPGAGRGLVYALLLSLALLNLPMPHGVARAAHEGEFAGRLAQHAQRLEARLAAVFEPAVRRTLHTAERHLGPRYRD